MNACMPSPLGKRELRPAEYQLSQVIKGPEFLFHTITAHICTSNYMVCRAITD